MKRRSLRSKIVYLVCLMTCLGGVSLALSRQQSISSDNSNISRRSPPLSVEQLQKLAKTITVKISAPELLGSGTLLQRQSQIYTVITNAHVLRAAKSPYQIQTADGRVYKATVLQIALQQDDLAVLQFRSPDIVYPVVNFPEASSLQVGDEVFVGGFISNLTTQKQINPTSEEQTQNSKLGSCPRLKSQPPEHSPLSKFLITPQSATADYPAGTPRVNDCIAATSSRSAIFVFTRGKITFLLNKALEQGYQIGYTNDVRKGMSGAPLLNIHGEVVGINSLHKDPIWDTPEVYQDGSQPEAHLQELITRSSMAVPIKKELLQNYQGNQS